MRAIGIRTKLMAEEGLFTLMETFMKVNGTKIRLKVKVFTSMLEEPNLLEFGKKICNTVKELKRGLTTPNSKANMNLERSTVLAPLTGATVQNMLENLIEII